MKDARRGKPVSDQLRHAFPCEPAFLAAPPERSPPEIGHIMPERRERPAICRDRIVGEVASHDLPQPFPLLWDRLMHSPQWLRLNVPQLSPHAVASGLPLKLEVAAARSTADEGEAQEREGFRLSKPSSLAIVRSKAPELNQARLVRVERQCKFPKPVMHRIKEATCVALILKADHQIVGISHDDHVAPGLLPSPALSPKVEAVMQVDIGEDRRNHRALACSPVIDCHDPVFEYTRSQPFLDEADDALVTDPMFKEANQPILANSPKEVPNVGVKYPVHLSYFDRRRKCVQRIMRSSSGSEPVGEADEVAFVDGIEHDHGRALDDLVLEGGDRQRPLFSIRLVYVGPAGWLRPIGSSLDPSMQILDPEFEVRLVVLPRHTIHAGGGFALKRVERRPERIDTDMVEERGELLLLPLPCGSPYAAQRLGHASPALRPVRALLIRVPLGPRPWLHRLRHRSPGFVRRLRHYYAGVRLLWVVHQRLRLLTFPLRTIRPQQGLWPIQRSPRSRTRSVRTCQGLSPRRVRRALAITRPPILPSVK